MTVNHLEIIVNESVLKNSGLHRKNEVEPAFKHSARDSFGKNLLYSLPVMKCTRPVNNSWERRTPLYGLNGDVRPIGYGFQRILS